ncbi:branched-chain amino acid ABC transporter permease [Massilia sp. CMS3.1]|uniref:branched-chain amino acid ABC transporter permease n=1 Tax=Massilia sp. CMS3.1 TaxID=3373083 RepID=UPI003EE63444
MKALKTSSCTTWGIIASGSALMIAAPIMPAWLTFLLTLSFAKALVVLGVVMQMRAGLVSFGQALYYCVGGYGVGLGAQFLGITDAFALLALSTCVAVILALIFGSLLTRFREIFFAMLTLALSMILYGVLVKSWALGSTDGFNIANVFFLGWEAPESQYKLVLYLLTVFIAAIAAIVIQRFLNSDWGRALEGVRENEIRIDYLGLSSKNLLFFNYVFAAAISALGGGLTALAAGHIDPDMALWTTSGEFVLIAILGGTSHVAAPFIGALVFALIRTFAVQHAPHFWQLTMGLVLLLLVLFLPKGIWSVVARLKLKGANA